MADAKLTAQTAVTAPNLADIVYMVINPATTPASRKITLQDLRGGYVLHATAASFDPADATTYYLGARYTAVPTTSANVTIVKIPRTGFITAMSLEVFTLGTLGSSTTSTIALYHNSTTAYTISSVVACNASLYSITTAAQIAVAVNDYFEIRWITPTWATNPTTVTVHTSIYIS